jgi:Amt family ammonium transporter
MATCVEEALAAVEESEVSGNPINMVLTDYNMPGRNGLDLARELKSHPQLIVLLLGSTDIHLSPSDLREHGIDATLRKPLRRHELHDVLCGLVDTAEEIEKHDGNESSASKETVMPSGHILLAEDNRINQLYMVELIKQLGCTCDTVVNGREATLAVQQGNYDLVLMDCQMPEMDGFEATRSIRQFETVAPIDRHLPIIALTANALKGDRERCLDAGMDDYLSKPVQKQQIIDLFERFFNNTNVPSLETGATVNGSEGVDGVSEVVPIDAESLMARCFGNVEFAESLLDELESTGVERLQEIQRYANEQNTVATADAAHALKGAAGILCAETVQKISAEIERRGRSSDVGDLESLVSDLASEMHRCLSSLPQLRKQLHLVKETI